MNTLNTEIMNAVPINAMFVDRSGLVDDLHDLYARTKAKIGDEDIRHIEKIDAYSKAIKARSLELLQNGESKNAFKHGVILYMLHSLLEFSELGHNIMHGGYNHLANAGQYHSDKFEWNFLIDPEEWKTMHHQNHHPFTNIVGKDHDIGYSFMRFFASQSWYGHHAIQPAFFALATFSSLPFTIFTATSAARTQGRKVLSKATFTKSIALVKKHALKNYIKEPLAAKPSRLLHTLFGNYLGATLGSDFVAFILALEHHAPNVKLFADTGDHETEEQYFIRQIYGTTNFTPSHRLNAYFKNILDQEVSFANPPDFEVFYGGLTTHLEHHLFPDLPCNRQREIVGEVKAILAKYDLPYNTIAFEDSTKHIIKSMFEWMPPIGDREVADPISLLRKPKELFQRLKNGFQFKTPDIYTYFKAPRFYNVPAKVVSTRIEANGQALSIHLQKPEGWEEVIWEAGAYLSVRFTIDNVDYVRQYSLTSDANYSQTMNITVKRVDHGLISNHINDHVKAGDIVTLIGLPQNDSGFVANDSALAPVYIAGGVGITPIISLIEKHVHENPNKPATLLYFNRNPQSVIFEPELKKLAKRSQLKIYFICDQHTDASVDMIEGRLSSDLLEGLLGDVAAYNYFVCSPPIVIQLAKQYLTQLGVPAEQFHHESFTTPEIKRAVSDGMQYTIMLSKSNRQIVIDSTITLLEATEKAGLSLPSGCKRGLCKACVCTKTSGQTLMNDKISSQENSSITLCNSFAKSDIVLDI
ncbi:fatty acid desaturase [Aquirhabdus parva]|nr:fatty acid desaturase [Aquirhabdus parva]